MTIAVAHYQDSQSCLISMKKGNHPCIVCQKCTIQIGPSNNQSAANLQTLPHLNSKSTANKLLRSEYFWRWLNLWKLTLQIKKKKNNNKTIQVNSDEWTFNLLYPRTAFRALTTATNSWKIKKALSFYLRL